MTNTGHAAERALYMGGERDAGMYDSPGFGDAVQLRVRGPRLRVATQSMRMNSRCSTPGSDI